MLLNQTILALIQKLWDRFWSGGISNPLAAIEQITYLLFIKRLDELKVIRLWHQLRQGLRQGLIDVGDDIVDVLNPNG